MSESKNGTLLRCGLLVRDRRLYEADLTLSSYTGRRLTLEEKVMGRFGQEIASPIGIEMVNGIDEYGSQGRKAPDGKP